MIWWLIAVLFLGHLIGFMAAALLSAAREYEHPCPHCGRNV